MTRNQDILAYPLNHYQSPFRSDYHLCTNSIPFSKFEKLAEGGDGIKHCKIIVRETIANIEYFRIGGDWRKHKDYIKPDSGKGTKSKAFKSVFLRDHPESMNLIRRNYSTTLHWKDKFSNFVRRLDVHGQEMWDLVNSYWNNKASDTSVSVESEFDKDKMLEDDKSKGNLKDDNDYL